MESGVVHRDCDPMWTVVERGDADSEVAHASMLERALSLRVLYEPHGGRQLRVREVVKRGEWAVIREGETQRAASSLQSRVRLGLGDWAPRGSFEGRSAKAEDGTFRVYARYVGEDTP
jgi:hypothetical protein